MERLLLDRGTASTMRQPVPVLIVLGALALLSTLFKHLIRRLHDGYAADGMPRTARISCSDRDSHSACLKA